MAPQIDRALADYLNRNFPYHTEHHFLPGLNCNDYAPLSRLLATDILRTNSQGLAPALA
jgi:fatty acid desaturase